MTSPADAGQDQGVTESRFLSALADHAEAPSDATWAALRASAADVDQSGHDGDLGLSRWAGDIGNRIGPLVSADPTAWAGLLEAILLDGSALLEYGPGRRLKDLSPFKGKALVYVFEADDGPIYYGETAPFLAKAVHGTDAIALPASVASLHAVDMPPAPRLADIAPIGIEETEAGC